MGDARRNDIIASTSDLRAWEQLVEPRSQTPTPAAAGMVEAEEATQVGGGQKQGDTTVPTAEDVGRARARLVLLRDSMLAPVQPQTDDGTSIFDGFEAKNSTRSSRWDAWQTLPPWSVCSNPECPLAEVGQ